MRASFLLYFVVIWAVLSSRGYADPLRLRWGAEACIRISKGRVAQQIKDPPANTHSEATSALVLKDINEGYLHYQPPKGNKDTVASRFSKGRIMNALMSKRIESGFWHLYDPNSGAFRLSPSHGGNALQTESGVDPLRAIRVHYGPFFKSNNSALFQVENTFMKDLLHATKGLTLDVWVVVEKKTIQKFDEFLKTLPESFQEKIKVVRSEGDLYPWAQDGSKPLVGGNHHPLTLQPHKLTGERPEYFHANQVLHRSGHVEVKHSPLLFEGGNIVVGQKHVFVGTKDIQRTMDYFAISRKDALLAFSNEFGKPVVEVGVPNIDSMTLLPMDLKQTAYHIDLSMAVSYSPKLQKEVIVLESPLRAYEMLLDIDVESLGRYDEFTNLLHKFLEEGGWKKLYRYSKEDGNDLSAHAEHFLIDFMSRTLENLQADHQRYLFLKNMFEKLGYEVHSVPGNIMSGIPDIREDNIKYLVNYTNVIFSENIAIIPKFNIPILDDEATKVYADLGFKVRHMPSTSQYMCSLGGLRCAAETYRR